MLLMLLLSPLARAQTTAPSDPYKVFLITMGAGDAVYEKFGHNAIAIFDTRNGDQVAYNFGVFDFDQPNFIGRFVLGRMLYSLEATRGDEVNAMLDFYIKELDRDLWIQELNLTAPQKQKLAEMLARNALPENKHYLYDYYRDNCSTRVRDVLDSVMDGELRRRWEGEYTDLTFRRHTRVGMQDSPLLYAGLSIVLGPYVDEWITRWETAFIPMRLREMLNEVIIDGEPLVIKEKKLHTSGHIVPHLQPPQWTWIFAVIGCGIGLGLLLCSPRFSPVSWTTPVVRWVGVVWSLFAGLAGSFIAFAQLCTDHAAGKYNQNFLLLCPLSLGLAWLLIRGKRRPVLMRRAGKLAMAIACVAIAAWVIKILPLAQQNNWDILLLASPIHAGLAMALRKPIEEAIQ